MKYFVTFMIIRNVVGEDGIQGQQVTYQNVIVTKHPLLWVTDQVEDCVLKKQTMTLLFWEKVNDKVVEECNKKLKEINEKLSKLQQEKVNDKEKSSKVKQEQDIVPMSGKVRKE